MRFLLDCNVLIALTDIDHTAHERTTAWFRKSGGLFATCPITQGAFIRFMLRVKADATLALAKRFLERIESIEGHEFWPDSVTYLDLPEAGVIGYRQVTDAYLVALAHCRNGRLATLDRALAGMHAAAATLIA
ncbi:MAG: TA system VapC family ribonuclease toxin [Bryobacteraceae bacterium]